MTITASSHELGVPVRRPSGINLFAGIDGEGRPCLYGVGEQHAPPFVLKIDPDKGVVRQLDAAPGIGAGRVAYWSTRWRSLFIAGMRKGRGVCLLRVGPAMEAIEEIPLPGGHEYPASIAEAPDGTVYVGTYPTCALLSYRPDTGKAVDFGACDDFDKYFYVACGSDGTVAGMVKMSRPHAVVIDTTTGEKRTVGPTADTDKGVGSVSFARSPDGLLCIDSHEGFFKLRGFELEPTSKPPEPQPSPPKMPDGSTYQFLDGFMRGLGYRKLEITRPSGERRVLELEYTAHGSDIYLVRPGIDGKLYGSSALPLRFFTYDPKTRRTTDHGAASTASGQTYSMDWLDGKLFFCVYTHAILSVYDPARPWTFPQSEEEHKRIQHTHRGYEDPRWPLRLGEVNATNPMQLGRMDNVAYRPRDMVAGPAGKIWVVSVPDYGMWGGTLSWYDPKADAFGGAHRHIIRDCSPVAITHIRDKNLLAIGFSIYPGSGADPRAKYAGLALWDPVRDAEVWSGDLGLESIGFMDIEYAGDGLVYAISHPWPKDVLHSELLLLDLPAKRIVARTRLDTAAGWPLEVSFQRDDRYLYGATRQGIYRVPLGTVDIEMIWRDEKDGPTAGGALLDGSYYFSTIERLRSVAVGG